MEPCSACTHTNAADSKGLRVRPVGVGSLSRRDRGRASTARGPYCTLASLGGSVWRLHLARVRSQGLVVGGRMGTLHGDDFSSDPRPPVETQSAWIHAVAIERWPRLSTKLADSMGRAGVGHRGGAGKCRSGDRSCPHDRRRSRVLDGGGQFPAGAARTLHQERRGAWRPGGDDHRSSVDARRCDVNTIEQ